MFLKSQRQPQCAYCGDERDPDDSYRGSYCTEQCYYEHRGDKALNAVRKRHYLCATCMTPIKSVEEPDDEWVDRSKSRDLHALNTGGLYHKTAGRYELDVTRCPDQQRTQTESVCGFQYRKPRAETVIKEFESPDGSATVKKTGTGCACGNTNPSKSVDALKDVFMSDVLENYVTMYRRLYHDGVVNDEIDQAVFVEAFEETGSWDYALGRALE